MDNEDYSLQDLLRLIEEKDSEKSPDLPSPIIKLSEVEKFIREKNVHKGVDRIELPVIYYTYREVWGGQLSKIQFFREFKQFFDQRRTGKKRVYMLDKRSFDMSRESLIKAEFHNKGKKKI